MPSQRIFHCTRTFSARIVFCVISFGLLSGKLLAQQDIKDFKLRAVVQKTSDEKMIGLAARGDDERISSVVKEHGGIVLHRYDNLVAFRIAVGSIGEIANHPAVEYLEFNGGRGMPLNDSMLVNSRIVAVHAGINGVESALSGKGVVVGLVDTGIELAHPDFQNADGTTRVKYLWDQNQTGNAPQPYDYGVEWTEEDINAEITGHQDQAQFFGHGSTVSGTAAGNGLSVAEYKGAAPEADLVVVSSDFGGGNWNLRVADAVKYVFDKADEMGKPAVVNLSLGNYVGSHDGLDAAALIIDSLIAEQPGRVVVCAAGNSGNWPAYHLGYEVTQDTSFTWFHYNASSGLGYGAVFLELWADTADLEDVHFAIGADKVAPQYNYRGRTGYRQIGEILGQVVTDSLKNGENLLGIVDYYGEVRGGQYVVQFHMAEPDSSQYLFRFITTGEGTFDIWSSSILGGSNIVAGGLPTVETFPDIENYKLPDKNKHTVSSWACSPKVITVGNYNNRDQYIDYSGNLQTFDPPAGELSVNSSHGPTRDNRIKPELSASGDLTLSSGKFSVLNALIANEPYKVAPGGMHYRNGGTSMASPVVSGIAALLLEQCPFASYETIREAILNNTYFDEFTGDSANNAYGYGKADASAALESLYFQPQFVQPTEMVLCAGETVALSMNQDYVQYTWEDDSTEPIRMVSDSGQYAVEVINQFGCIGRSDTVSVSIHPLPEVQIEQQLDTLFAEFDAQWTYQWLFNGEHVVGAEDYFIVPSEAGVYSLMVEDTLGCTDISNEIDFAITSIGSEETKSWEVFPIPVRDRLWIRGGQGIRAVIVWSADGREAYRWENTTGVDYQHSIDTENWPGGFYLVRVSGADRTETFRFISN